MLPVLGRSVADTERTRVGTRVKYPGGATCVEEEWFRIPYVGRESQLDKMWTFGIVLISECGSDLVLDVGGGDEEEFVAGFEGVVGLGDDDPAAAENGDQGGVAGEVDLADGTAGEGGVLGEGHLDEVGLALAQGEELDQVADADRLLDHGGEQARRGHPDVDAPGLVEQTLVGRVVDPGDHP